MKTKFILFVAALATLASCDKTISSVDETRAIGFEGAFVNNAVKATDTDVVTAANLPAFYVHGFADTVKIFDGQQVTKPATGNIWSYSPIQYWTAGHTYGFTAISAVKNGTASAPNFTAPASQAQGGSIAFTNDGETDLLYDYQTVTTANPMTTCPMPVAFTFKHMLARVKFTAKNSTATDDNTKLTVTNIVLKNATKSATLACSADNCKAGVSPWAADANADDLILDFGNAGTKAIVSGASASSDQWHYIIPTNDALNAFFTVEIDNNGVKETKKYEVTIPAFNWATGYSYNFIADLTREALGEDCPIQFTVANVEGWVDWNNAGADDTWFTAPGNGATISTVANY